ncbi:MAG: ABC-F family ATP-binding cassette domain-containing protein [Alphaproteobacteria bacterium]|nr:ABC-F family ATP-binding cassette domain-containing protein [Alphaproteobacteria bacterium]
MILLDNITLQIAHKVLIKDSSLSLSDGQKVGIVGTNGCGKSTLFKVLKGQLDLLKGTISLTSKDRVAFVEQELSDTSVSLLDFVMNADTKVKELKTCLQQARPEELADIYEALHLADAETLEARASQILKGLGFEPAEFLSPLSQFSGGWRMRVALAGALIKPSDVMLLDEPTNHLDLEGSLWLTDFLQKYKGTLLLISHDKQLLNDVCQYIMHFEGQKLVLYSGNYNTFQKSFALKKQNSERQASKQADKKAHLEKFVERFRYKATKAKQAQSRLKMLAKMEDVATVSLDKSSHFDFGTPLELPSPFFVLENGATGYREGEEIISHVNLSLNFNDRIALLGKNGNGKSTLAKLIAEELPLMAGKITKSKKLNIGFFNQHQGEELPLDETPTTYLSSFMAGKTEPQIRSYLARFGLEGDKALTLIERLSGGEKARLLFAKITLNAPELLILDEPTNHLDIGGREALIDALNAFTGAVILITHDFHLLELVAEKLYLIENHTLSSFEGDLNDYRAFLFSKLTENKASLPDPPLKEKKQKKKEEHVQKSLSKKEIRQRKATLLKIEETLALLEREKKALIKKLTLLTEGDKIASCQKELKHLEKKLLKEEEKWMMLSDEISS